MKILIVLALRLTVGCSRSSRNGPQVQVWNDANNTLHLARHDESVLISEVPVFNQLASIQDSVRNFKFSAPSQRDPLHLPLSNATRINVPSGFTPLFALDDDLLAVSGLADTSHMYSVFIYRLLNRSWTNIQVLAPQLNRTIIELAVARSANLATIVITTFHPDKGFSSFVYTAVLTDGTFLFHSTNEKVHRLPAVAIAASATIYVTSSSYHCHELTVYDWTQNARFDTRPTTIDAPTQNVSCNFGASIVMVGEQGQTVIVGAPREENRTYSEFVAIYDRVSKYEYTFTQQVRPKHLHYGWGSCVAAQGDILLVGAQSGSTERRPSVVVYQRFAGFYRQVQELRPRTLALSFRNSLAVYGNTIAVGSSQADGGVYLYQLRDDNNRSVCVDILGDNTTLPNEPADSTYSVALGQHGLIVVAIRKASSHVYSLLAGT